MRRVPFVLFALLLLVAAGCGSDSDQPAFSGDPTTSTTDDTDDGGLAESTTTTATPPALECSAATLDENEGEAEVGVDLAAPVAERRSAILDAAFACDYEQLESLALEGSGEFNYSFGAPDGEGFADHLRQQEEDGQPVTQRLVETLRLPNVVTDGPTDAEQLVIWPSVAGPDEASEDDWSAVAEVYTAEEVQAWRAPGTTGFLGYRVGITAAGDWLFFVAGD